MIILPRQARDKHRENSPKKTAFPPSFPSRLEGLPAAPLIHGLSGTEEFLF
jgi:hypothetical protein